VREGGRGREGWREGGTFLLARSWILTSPLRVKLIGSSYVSAFSSTSVGSERNTSYVHETMRKGGGGGGGEEEGEGEGERMSQ